MTAPNGIDRWAEFLRPQVDTLLTDADSRIVVELSRKERLSLGTPPKSPGLTIITHEPLGELVLESDADALVPPIAIYFAESVHALRLNNVLGSMTELKLEGAAAYVDVFDLAVGSLSVVGLRCRLRSVAAPINSVHLTDADFYASSASIGRLYLRDRNFLRSISSVAATIVETDPLEIRGEGQVRLGSILGDAPVNLVLYTEVSLASIPPDSSIESVGPDASLVFAPPVHPSMRGRSRGLTYRGGSLAVHGVPLSDLRLGSGITGLQVVGGQVFDVHGLVELFASQEAIVAGSHSNPVRAYRITHAKSSQLEYIDIPLDFQSLSCLKECERLLPWVPDKKTRRARERSEEEAGNRHLARRMRAHYWARLVAILKESHAPASVQGAVRFEAARARRRALPRGLEKSVLGLYSLVGYGEHVGRPLIWMMVLSSFGARLLVPSSAPFEPLSAEAWGNFVRAWTKIVSAPLAFFRFLDFPEAAGLWSNLALAIVVAMNVLLLFFALATVRRLAKPD